MRDSDLLDAFNPQACSRTCQWWSKCFLIPKSWTSKVSIRWTHNWMCLFYQQQGINNSNHLSLSRVDRYLLILVRKFQLYGFTPYCSKSTYTMPIVFCRHTVKKCFWFFPFYLFFVFVRRVNLQYRTQPNIFTNQKRVKKKHDLLLPPHHLCDRESPDM